jgi:hypothetical protein
MSKDAPEILSGLESIPWHKLEHAYGPATDVPHLLRVLASSDGELRDKAWYTLHGNLWHQGTIYEATAYAVPFFIRLIEGQSVPEKYRILLYLALLFNGRSYWDVHKELTILKSEVSKPGFQEKLDNEMEWVRAVKTAIRAGRGSYVQQLHDPEVQPRIASAYLLGLIDGGIDGAEGSVLEEIARSCEP